VKVLLPYLLEKKLPLQQLLEKPTASYRVLSDKDEALLSLRKKLGSVTLVFGSRDTGKTELCYRFMEFLGRPCYAVSPQQRPPPWIKRLKLEDIFKEVPPCSTLFLDDLPAYMSNKDYNDALARAVEKVIPMVRHAPAPPEFPIGRCHLIFASQSAAQADKYILDCDLAFLKPLGLLTPDMERPNVRRIYEKLVDPIFEGKSERWTQRHAFMLSRQYKGLIDIKRAINSPMVHPNQVDEPTYEEHDR